MQAIPGEAVAQRIPLMMPASEADSGVLPPGNTVDVTIIRGKQEKSIPVNVGVRPRQK